ncbi:hypothetical protein MTR67_018537 [Solanum verrucosum]|uniref:Uncharacterized protein n=1 Tax=Solanum verrucosum TaxID=315347 RepID=A0AAF0QJV4_SOLVR|nr:hypothetical protein MTR67_018537 [Solanum verrucosum]
MVVKIYLNTGLRHCTRKIVPQRCDPPSYTACRLNDMRDVNGVQESEMVFGTLMGRYTLVDLLSITVEKEVIMVKGVAGMKKFGCLIPLCPAVMKICSCDLAISQVEPPSPSGQTLLAKLLDIWASQGARRSGGRIAKGSPPIAKWTASI